MNTIAAYPEVKTSEPKRINLPEVVTSTVLGVITVVPIHASMNITTSINLAQRQNGQQHEQASDDVSSIYNAINDLSNTISKLADASENNAVTEDVAETLVSEFPIEILKEGDMTTSFVNSELDEKQARLEKSANKIGVVLFFTLIIAIAVGFFASWGYSLIIAAPFVAGLGILWSHGIQLNKIDSLMTENK